MTDPVFWSGDSGLTLPPGRPTWTTPEMTPPLFWPVTTAQVFFARGREWLARARWEHEITDEMLGPVEWKRYGMRSTRLYSLHNIERLTYVLAEHRVLIGMRAAGALHAVLAVARQHGYRQELDDVAREAARDHRS